MRDATQYGEYHELCMTDAVNPVLTATTTSQRKSNIDSIVVVATSRTSVVDVHIIGWRHLISSAIQSTACIAHCINANATTRICICKTASIRAIRSGTAHASMRANVRMRVSADIRAYPRAYPIRPTAAHIRSACATRRRAKLYSHYAHASPHPPHIHHRAHARKLTLSHHARAHKLPGRAPDAVPVQALSADMHSDAISHNRHT